jgi:hypothetical protein
VKATNGLLPGLNGFVDGNARWINDAGQVIGSLYESADPDL